MNEFKICNKCNEKNFEKLKQMLIELDSTAKIFVGCQSMCAIGKNKYFVIVNGIHIISDDLNQLIEKVKLNI